MLVRLDNVASFRPGNWNGAPYTAATLAAIHANVQRFSSGNSPYYRPYVSVNHDDALACGDVVASRLDSDHVLHLDALVPPQVPGLIHSGRLRAPSVELFLPPAMSGQPNGFPLPGGGTCQTPVLKCLTLLGADSPGVHGLAPLSAALFRTRSPSARFGAGLAVAKFSGSFTVDPTSDPTDDATVETGMTREEMLALLSQAGWPAPPGEITDEALSYIVASMQAAAAANATQAPPPADPAAVAAFRAQSAGFALLSRQLKANEARTSAAKVALFRAEMTGGTGQPARMTPAQFDDWAASNGRLSDLTVVKFAHDARGEGSQLDEAIDRTRKAYSGVVARKFGAQVGTRGSGASDFDATRARILKRSEIGRRLLAKDAK